METATIEQTAAASEGGLAINLGQIGQLTGELQIGQISNYRVLGDSHFYELKLDRPEGDLFEDPPLVEELAAILAEDRLLVLAGELEDKAECARRIAGALARQLAGEGLRVVVRERCRGKDPQRIEAAFHNDHATILLLTEISQSLIAGYGPAKLRALLVERGGYAIVTTDCTRGQWDIGDGAAEARLWRDLGWDTFYGRDRLADYLERLLFGSHFEIQPGLLGESPEGDLRIGDIPLARAAETLKTPERIASFVRSLTVGSAPIAAEQVEEKLAELAGDAAAIRQWYLQFSDRDQLLVVGLVLLDGLPDDLLFAGLEILVETTWRETDPNFLQFDYRDLSRFAAYFKQTSVDGGFLRIESGSRRRRADILQVAWNHQRRRLLATLPALTEMIRVSASESATTATRRGPGSALAGAPASAARQAAERALSRTRSGSTQLRMVVVESLSLIGLVSLEVVEPYLLDLATEPAESVRALVAQALAAWREAGRELEFFALLARWWSDACDIGNRASAIARGTSSGADPWASVRSTVALTIGYAAQYDRENHLAPRLLELLGVLVDDPHPVVREAVWKHALPRIVAWHLRQLEPFLRQRVLVAPDFVDAVARGAAEACALRPEESLAIVDSWWQAARSDRRHGRGTTILPREVLVATVAKTFGYARNVEGRPETAPAELVARLRSVLLEEGNPFVRRHALQAIEAQVQLDSDLAAPLLPELITRLAFADRRQVVALAVRAYLHQRLAMSGGERKVEIDGRSYAVWIGGARPLTAIEVALYGWLLDLSRPVAQQVAVASFAAFAATELEREEQRLRRAEPSGGAVQEGGEALAAEPEVHPLSTFGHLAVIAATPGKEEIRPLLRPLMAEVIVEHRWHLKILAEKVRRVRLLKRSGPASPPALEASQEDALRPAGVLSAERLETLLERWGEVRNPSARALAEHLRRAVSFYRWRWGMVAAMVLAVLALGCVFRWADRRVGKPLGMLAEELIRQPMAVEELMAPLPPGATADVPLRFPYVLPCVGPVADHDRRASGLTFEAPWVAPLPSLPLSRLRGEALFQFTEDSPHPRFFGRRERLQEGWRPPAPPYVLRDLAAPLPPGRRGAADSLRAHREAPAASWGTTPKERAWAWRKRIWLTR